MPLVRSATHAGTWYSSQGTQLRQQLSQWLDEAEAVEGQHARIIIAPHAGYRYSGHVAAYAYKRIDPSLVRRVFLLGPSHHVYSKHCLLSTANSYATPLGSITVDAGVVAALRATGRFRDLSAADDAAEHSLELHLPYLVHALAPAASARSSSDGDAVLPPSPPPPGGSSFTLVPIVVGALSAESEAAYGRMLAPYLADPANLWVVSTDFCHWGRRFNYTRRHDPERHGDDIAAGVEALDREGMALIEAQDAPGFHAYLQRTGNTICGRHPVALLLHALRHCPQRFDLSFTKYDQSQRCAREADSSVSYASAVGVAAPDANSYAAGR